jgi:hypothetical protein
MIPSGEGESPSRHGDRTAEFLGSFDPFLSDDLYVGKGFFVGLSVCGAARKFGDLGDNASSA